MKRLLSFIVLKFIAVSALAQVNEPIEKSFWSDPVNDPMLPIYFATAFILFVIIVVSIVAIYLIKILNLLSQQAEKENAKKLGIAYKPKQSWWNRFIQRMNASVPVENEKNIELAHSYDGIKELDNHLPPWWTWLFYGTIAWAVIYLVVFHLSDTLPLQAQEYQHEVAMAEEQAEKLKASQPVTAIDENNLVFTADAAIIEKGKLVFMNNNCGACHRNDGGGNTIGPNLTDEYWLHGGDVKQVFSTIKNGIVEKGMPAWGKALGPKDVRDVTFFILSLKGTNPADAKAPQGEIHSGNIVPSDSVKSQASL